MKIDDVLSVVMFDENKEAIKYELLGTTIYRYNTTYVCFEYMFIQINNFPIKMLHYDNFPLKSSVIGIQYLLG